MTTNGVI